MPPTPSGWWVCRRSCGSWHLQLGSAHAHGPAQVLLLVIYWQAPEVLEGRQATAASDIYSFGMVRGAWCMLSGILPARLPASFCCGVAMQVLFELLTWRLPFTFANMSPFKVCSCGQPLWYGASCATASASMHHALLGCPTLNKCRLAPPSGRAGGRRSPPDTTCLAPTLPAGLDWTVMCC